MTEVSFAQTFLSTLDARPLKLSADHVEDPHSFPARAPYILPRMPKPMSKPTSLAPGQERSITVHLKSLRNPPLDIKLTSQPLNTSILDIKNAVSSQTRIPIDKMKVLHSKRPVQDSKILRDVVVEDEGKIEFSVMVLGGAGAVPPAPAAGGEKDAQGSIEDTDEFWSDLRGFLQQRLKDESRAGEMVNLFKSSWKSRTTNS